MVVTTQEDIREGVRRLGLCGQPLCVHASLRSFGWVMGGAQTVVDGLVAEGCTILVPAFSWDAFAISPPHDLRPARNGWDYETVACSQGGVGRIYSPASAEIDTDMGAISAAVLRVPGRARGNHPLCSFAAIGPLAKELVSGQGPVDVLAPLAQLAARGGFLVLMGVGLEVVTAVHLSEVHAGRTLFRRWANGPDGRPIVVEVGGCSRGFKTLEPALKHLMKTVNVGQSTWTVFPAQTTVEAAAAVIRRDLLVTHCSDPACRRCNDAVAGGPILEKSTN